MRTITDTIKSDIIKLLDVWLWADAVGSALEKGLYTRYYVCYKELLYLNI